MPRRVFKSVQQPGVDGRAGQEWFWSQQWQEREREVDRHVERGETRRFESNDAFLAFLDTIASGAKAG